MISGLWRDADPLALASGSRTRRDMLEAAGIPVEVCAASIDERAVDAEARAGGASAADVATFLAVAKARDVSARMPGRLVLGADQTLACEGRQFDKPAYIEAGKDHLRFFSGKRHQLHSAAALVRNGQIVAQMTATASLVMRPLSEAFIEAYAQAAGERVLMSVGGYQLEGLGSQLFSAVEGDHFTVLGLPLLQLQDQLRTMGLLVG